MSSPTRYEKEFSTCLETVKEETHKRLEQCSYLTKKGIDKLSSYIAKPLYIADEDSIYWWDDDKSVFFGQGFFIGIVKSAGFAGYTMGYGYDYTKGMLKDLNIQTVPDLLGTKEENEKKIHEDQIRWIKMQNEYWDNLMKSKF